MQIGKIFTNETFSKYFTKEVLFFLEPEDFRNVLCLNKFCASFANDEEFIPVMARKNFRNGTVHFSKVVESDQIGNRSVIANEQVICLLLGNGFTIFNKDTKITSHFKASDVAGPLRGHDIYEIGAAWVNSDVLIVGFPVKRVEKRDTYYLSPSTYIFYNVKSGIVERTCQLKLPFHKFTTIGFNYDSAIDTLTLVQNTMNEVRTVVWNLTQNTHKVVPFSGGTNGKLRAVHGDYLVSANLKGIHYYKISSDMLISFVDFPKIQRISQISLCGNLIVAHEELPNLNVLWHIWEVKAESIVPASTIKVEYQDNLKILLGVPVVPTPTQPFPLFASYTIKQKLAIKLADFTLKGEKQDVLQINILKYTGILG